MFQNINKYLFSGVYGDC